MNSSARPSTYSVRSIAQRCWANSAIQMMSAWIDVALRRARLEALDGLLALVVRALGELEQLGLEPLVGVALVEALDRARVAAGRVLARAERHVAGGVARLVQRRRRPSRRRCSPPRRRAPVAAGSSSPQPATASAAPASSAASVRLPTLRIGSSPSRPCQEATCARLCTWVPRDGVAQFTPMADGHGARQAGFSCPAASLTAVTPQEARTDALRSPDGTAAGDLSSSPAYARRPAYPQPRPSPRPAVPPPQRERGGGRAPPSPPAAEPLRPVLEPERFSEPADRDPLEAAAAAWGATRTWALPLREQADTAVCLSLRAARGRQVVVQRDAHPATVAGLVVAGLEPHWLAPEVDPIAGVAHGVTPASLDAALTAAPGARAAIVVAPAFHGALPDVAAAGVGRPRPRRRAGGGRDLGRAPAVPPGAARARDRRRRRARPLAAGRRDAAAPGQARGALAARGRDRPRGAPVRAGARRPAAAGRRAGPGRDAARGRRRPRRSAGCRACACSGPSSRARPASPRSTRCG